MKLVHLMVALVCWSFFPQFTPSPESNVCVYVFLSEECIISQSYSLELRQLHEDFSGGQFEFVGVFPNPSSTPAKMAAFKEAYAFPFDFQLDRQQRLMDQFGVSVTPEVVVYDRQAATVLYQGRIDNTFYRVGRRRQVTTTNELTDALAAIEAGEPVPVARTETVGCFITPAGAMIKNAPMCDDPNE